MQHSKGTGLRGSAGGRAGNLYNVSQPQLIPLVHFILCTWKKKKKKKNAKIFSLNQVSQSRCQAEKSLVTPMLPSMCSLHQGMEGKGITELSDTSTAAREWPRFTCHLEENSISFCDLLRVKVKVVRPGRGLGSISRRRQTVSLWQPAPGNLTFPWERQSSCAVIPWFRLRCRLPASYRSSSLPVSHLEDQLHPFLADHKWCFLGVRTMALSLQVC